MKKIFTILLAIALVVKGMAQSTQVKLTSGLAEGAFENGIYTYKGIPYAKADRFTAPQAPDSWLGVRTFTEYGQMSSQASMGFGGQSQQMNMGDDCQNLNVWTPQINDGKKRPVMVWLHGGGFQSGSSQETQTDGTNLSRKGDVVVVSINHRLNVLGFLNLADYGEKYKYSGNAGIYDIVVALQWIQQNIEVFGGDPDNVTLFGESGGGAKIIVLAASPMAKGLFHKGIIESGAVENIGMTNISLDISREVAQNVLKNLNIDPANVDQIQSIPYDRLNQAGNDALKTVAVKYHLEGGFRTPDDLSWSSTVDGDFLPEDPVVSKTPEISRNIPLIIGSNFSEMQGMTSFMNPDFQTSNKNTWTENEVNERIRNQFGNQTPAVINAFRKAYPTRPIADVLFLDTWLRSRALKYLNLRAQEGGAPVYSYMFAYDSKMNGGLMMVPHTAEIAFVFNNPSQAMMYMGAGEEAEHVADVMSGAWIAFAQTGNPNHAGMNQWPAYTIESKATMVFDKESKVSTGFDDELIHLLMSISEPDYKF